MTSISMAPAEFHYWWNLLQHDCYQESYNHGFHGTFEKDNVPTKLMLIVSELGEALEAHRKGLESDHCPGLSGMQEELADVQIRLFDLAEMLGMDLLSAVMQKHNFNKTRPYLHGDKAY
jgi:NTP pyrophosphatase (non-canonical NTP hydrolase)